MRWLPALPEPLQAVVLPMADRSAAAIFEALVCGDTTPIRAGLTTALKLDPSLSLWVVVHIKPNCERLDASELAAAWLQQGLNHLNWPADATFEIPTEDARRFAELAARHVSYAASFAQGSGADAEAAYFAGLLASAGEWIEQCGGPNDCDLQQLLPSSVRARAEERAEIEPNAGESSKDMGYLEKLPLVQLLPELAVRLNRVSALEGDFDGALEEAKLRALYTLAAGAGHEINNPLGSIAGRAQLLIRDEQDAERRRTLAKINSQAFRAHEMISDMMLFAKPPEPVREPVDLTQIAREVIDGLREEAEQRNTKLDEEIPHEPVILRVDATQITVALRAMCVNALEALGGGGRVAVRIDVRDGQTGRLAEIVVEDNGPGIEPAQLDHIFDPFYSGREAGRGLGFGLSKTWRIINNHGGKIEVNSEPGRGSQFKIRLPAA